MSGSKPTHFFAPQLAGEEPLSLETAARLHSLAGKFWELRPWLRLDETQLILIEDSSGQRHVCSVMGAAGQHTALAVYVGAKGYAFFRMMQEAVAVDAGEFLARQHSLSVEFDGPSQLTKPDRELLRAFGYTRSKGNNVPIFRTVRPGYHPWYVTEDEGKLLAQGLHATNTVVESLQDGDEDRLWRTPGTYPLVVRSGAVEMGSPPPAERAPLARPQLDEAWISRILGGKYARRETLELDQLWAAVTIGQKNERKACMRVGAAINAETGFAYPPRVISPELPAAQLLADTLLGAIESTRFLPKNVHVRNAEYQEALRPLAHLLGCDLKAASTMPALDFFKRELLASMGERGPIPL